MTSIQFTALIALVIVAALAIAVSDWIRARRYVRAHEQFQDGIRAENTRLASELHQMKLERDHCRAALKRQSTWADLYQTEKGRADALERSGQVKCDCGSNAADRTPHDDECAIFDSPQDPQPKD